MKSSEATLPSLATKPHSGFLEARDVRSGVHDSVRKPEPILIPKAAHRNPCDGCHFRRLGREGDIRDPVAGRFHHRSAGAAGQALAALMVIVEQRAREGKPPIFRQSATKLSSLSCGNAQSETPPLTIGTASQHLAAGKRPSGQCEFGAAIVPRRSVTLRFRIRSFPRESLGTSLALPARSHHLSRSKSGAYARGSRWPDARATLPCSTLRSTASSGGTTSCG